MWMKIDDRLHAHRKTRAVTKSHPGKARDAAPFGLWVLAGSWSSQNGTDGWVPEDELDRWDDDWPGLAERLVLGGYWWRQQRDREPGFGFTDWRDYNPSSEAASQSGEYGNHIRWHEQRGLVEPSCEHCPKEPESADSVPENNPDSGGDIGGRSGGDIGGNRSTRPDPEPEPNPNPDKPRAKRSDREVDITRFDEFWETYSHKVGRKKAETAYQAALKKPGVTEELLIASAAAYITWQMAEGKHPKFTKHAATWLAGEHWRDERPARQAPQGRVGQHLALARQLAEQDTIPQIGARP